MVYYVTGKGSRAVANFLARQLAGTHLKIDITTDYKFDLVIDHKFDFMIADAWHVRQKYPCGEGSEFCGVWRYVLP